MDHENVHEWSSSKNGVPIVLVRNPNKKNWRTVFGSGLWGSSLGAKYVIKLDLKRHWIWPPKKWFGSPENWFGNPRSQKTEKPQILQSTNVVSARNHNIMITSTLSPEGFPTKNILQFLWNALMKPCMKLCCKCASQRLFQDRSSGGQTCVRAERARMANLQAYCKVRCTLLRWKRKVPLTQGSWAESAQSTTHYDGIEVVWELYFNRHALEPAMPDPRRSEHSVTHQWKTFGVSFVTPWALKIHRQTAGRKDSAYQMWSPCVESVVGEIPPPHGMTSHLLL